MSRVGKKPISIPDGVTVKIDGQTVNVEGKLGKNSLEMRDEIAARVDDDGKEMVVEPVASTRLARALHGTYRSILAGMVQGVHEGYVKKLEIQGVGYLGAVQGDTLQLRVGFANELHVPIPAGLTVTCPDQQHIHVTGVDKQMVTQFAAAVRSLRKPEPYNGKGIRYEGEAVRRKEGKASVK